MKFTKFSATLTVALLVAAGVTISVLSHGDKAPVGAAIQGIPHVQNPQTAVVEEVENNKSPEVQDNKLKENFIFPSNVAKLDSLFKRVSKSPKPRIAKDEFSFLQNSQIGDRVSFQVADQVFEGRVTVAQFSGISHQHVIQLDDGVGNAVFTNDGNDILRGHIALVGDSRVFLLKTEQKAKDQTATLVWDAGQISDLFCAPVGTIYDPKARVAGLAPATSKASPDSNTAGASVPVLTSDASLDYVIYCDFDGETVTNTIWNSDASDPDAGEVSTINAAAHPKSTNESWVTAVFERVAEDFAPFDITVTTDRAVFDDAAATQRVHVIVTPSSDWYPLRYPNENAPGGVAYRGSFNDISPIVWVFNQEEYLAADTISHEVGHALKLSHDGRGNFDEYYGGHGTGETSWAPIMGAPWSDGIDSEEVFGGIASLYENVTQWSRGEYAQADNQENDIGLIIDTATLPPSDFLSSDGPHGFGLKGDDYSDMISGLDPSEPIGLFDIENSVNVSGSGVIETATDVDIFQFATIPGIVDLSVSVLDVESEEGESGSSTQGANLAVEISLIDSNGVVLETVSPSGALSASIRREVSGGTFFLSISGASRGTPITGFSEYGSLGYYSVAGSISAPPLQIFGGSKQDIGIPEGDTTPIIIDGTNFGMVVVGAPAKTATFRLENTSSTTITNILPTFGAGAPFSVLSAPTEIPGGGSALMQVRMAPSQTGLFRDDLSISYSSAFPTPLVFNFSFEGTAISSAFTDNYEPNNYTTNATPLDNFEGVWLSEYKGLAYNSDDYDWYRFQAEPEDAFILVEADFTFSTSQSDVLITLHNSFGNIISTMSTNEESGVLGFTIPEETTNRNFYILVRPVAGIPTGNTYDLRWSATGSADSGGDDFYEENDNLQQAYDLTSQPNRTLSQIVGLGRQFDEDWYKIEVPRDPRLRFAYVKCTFNQAEGDIVIELWGPSFLGDTVPGFLGRGASSDGREVLAYSDFIRTADVADTFDPVTNTVIDGILPGTYYVRVRSGNAVFFGSGTGAGNEYDLTFDFIEDDRYEVVDELEGTENDSRNTPFDLGTEIVGQWLSEIDGDGVVAAYSANSNVTNFSNRNDDDWYRFSLAGVSGTAQQVILSFDGFIGSGFLDFEIRTTGGAIVAEGNTLQNQFRTIDPVTGNFVAQIALVDPADTEYLIHVEPRIPIIDNLTSYDFRIDVTADLPTTPGTNEDNYEQNDTFYETFDLTQMEGAWLATIDGYGYLSDNDWYRIAVPQNAARLVIRNVFDRTEGDIEMSLFSENGPVDLVPIRSGTEVRLEWDNPPADVYFLGVYGDYAGNAYNLNWSVELSEDTYEENDSAQEADDRAAQAGNLILPESTWLSKVDGPGVQADEDWYKVLVATGDIELEVKATFDHLDGDIDIELYDDQGFIVGRSVSSSSNENIRLLALTPGFYYIRVYFENAGNEYDLWWRSATQSELSAISEDNYEENDSLIGAFSLGDNDQANLSATDGLATQTDEDWYSIQIDEGNVGLFVEVDFFHAEGDIDLELYDSLQSLLAFSRSETDGESINMATPLAAGTYYLRLYGSSAGNPYDFYWVDLNEDIYEDNDFREESYNLTEDSGIPLSSLGVPTQGDDDWYRVAVGQDNSFLSVELSYVHANGNIDLELYDSTGALVPNSTSATVGDNESFFLQLSAGDYFIKVFGDDAYNDYDLEWNVFEDDIYEENDFDTGAENISAFPGTVLSATQFDDDWFSVEIVDPNATFFVNLAFIHADGNIDLEIYDEIGALAPIASATSTDDNEAISFQPSAAGTYYIRVFGDDRNIAYTLVWNSILDDGFEENDTFLQSTDTSLIVAQALDAVQLDNDWFQIDVPAGDVRLDILLEFLHADGDLGFEIYDSGEVLLNTVNSSTDNESITFGPDPVGASYFIKVFGPNTGTDYTLSWTSSTRDSFEGEEGGQGNNVIDDAFDLTDTESRFLQDVGGLGTLYDEDWYAITHTDSDLLVEAVFTHANGNIDIEVFNPGGLRIGGSTSATDDVERIELFNIPTGTYYIRVFGDTSSGNSYDLIWNSFNEDNLETSVEFDLLLENDTHSEATDIMARELLLESDLTQLDDDWYIIAVAGSDDTLTVRVEFEHLFGNIDLELYDETEVFVPGASSLSNTDNESLTISGLSPGNYYLRVFGRNVANSYTLRWNSFSEDPYDNDGGNNSKVDAYNLTSNENKTLTEFLGQGVQLNEDWYKVERSAVGSLFMFVQLSYTAAHGNLDLRVYDESGALMAESVQASGSPETVNFSDLGPETYYILVTGDDFGIPYELIWRSVPDDIFEENDSIANAYDWDTTRGLSLNAVNDPTGSGAIQRDPDYYRVEVPAGQLRLEAIATFIDIQGNLSLEIFNEAGQSLGSVDSADDDESLKVIISEFPAAYYILVDGSDEGTAYDLVWNYDNEDNYEINDSSLEAFKLNVLGGNAPVPQPGINDLLADGNGPATQTNEDYYSLFIPASQLTLTVDMEFDHGLGDINFEILDDALNSLGTASSVDDNESLTVTVNQTADLNADPPESNRYYIRVFGDDAGNRYNLTWATSRDDVYEINNFIEDAYDLTGQENVWLSDSLGLGAQLNDDWFIIVVSTGSVSLSVEATFTHDDLDNDTVNDGDINLDLYQIVNAAASEVNDSTIDQRRPVLVDRADSTTDDEIIIFNDGGSLLPGLYYLRVYFQNAGNRYDLRWDDGVDDVAGDATYTDDIGQFVFTNPNPAAAPANFASNPDGDIFPNWAEYALALDASSPDQLQISQQIEEIGGEEYYTISFLRSKEAAARNFEYLVEESTDLIFDGTEAAYVRTESVTTDVERVVYRCNSPRSEAPSCFFRVTVNEPASGY